MKRMNKKGGFTLIELLVVIAIIGILSSVVLVSLNSARNKGKDTRVISDVNQLRTAFESGYNGASYPDLGNNIIASTTGPQGTTTTQLINDAVAQGGVINVITDGATATKYAIYGKLPSNPNAYFCISSDGSTAQATSTNSQLKCNN
jgi:prepilin-type N-terminal cleavage/methylation domain-containing protein